MLGIDSSIKIQTKSKKKIQFDFEDEVEKDFDERGNTKMNFYADRVKDSNEDGLEDSNNEDEHINERPLSALKRKGMSNNEALLDILEKTEKDRERVRKSLSQKKRIPAAED